MSDVPPQVLEFNLTAVSGNVWDIAADHAEEFGYASAVYQLRGRLPFLFSFRDGDGYGYGYGYGYGHGHGYGYRNG